jgi:hypothetical protein
VKGDLILYLATVLCFAVALTAHVTIVAGLAVRTPRVRALLALLFAPLAPYWAVRERMGVRAAAWVIGLVGYAIARWVGHAGRG